MKKRIYLSLLIVSLMFLGSPHRPLHIKEPASIMDRQVFFETLERQTGVPWYYLAAMDQYERNIRSLKCNQVKQKDFISIRIPSHLWAGLANPDLDDTIPESIQFFQGIGTDANGDGKADPADHIDILFSIARYLTKNGTGEDDIREQIWRYYQHPTAVDVITHIARTFASNHQLDLDEQVFPIPLQYHYNYRDSWGAKRVWGGSRTHEGTDIFAGYGTPVLSTCHGYVELIGWNDFGGWRVGIRDIHNNYHYFAHLNGFRKGLKKGDIVKPGELIGYVGSSGYGPPGTVGKFPPHLHYGIYKFNGDSNYSFNPYPLLKKWEQEAYQKREEQRNKRKANQPSDDLRDKKFSSNNHHLETRKTA